MPRRSLANALLCVLCASLVAELAAQTSTESADRPPIGEPNRPPDGAPPHLKLIDRHGLRDHAYWLAHDERAGRYTGSQGQQATSKYVADHFKRLGLRPLGDKRGYLQKYPLESVYIAKGTGLTFGRTKVESGYAVLPHGDDDKVSLRGKFAWCGNGTAKNLPSLKGRIPLVVLHDLRAGSALGGRLQALNRFRAIARKLGGKGASGALVCLLADHTTYGDVLTTNALLPGHPKLQFGNGGRRGGATSIPLFVINKVQSLRLFQHIGIDLDEDGAPKTAPTRLKATGTLKIVVKRDEKASATNVVAVLDGKSRKKEAIVYSAHHDHIGYRLDGDAFNGADDNASGTAGLLEIAEAFAKGGPPPARSIIFLSVSGEELGLWGSKWFSDNPTWPLGKIVANINIDMIGRAGGTAERIKMQVTPSHDHGKYSSMVQDAVGLGSKFGIEFTSGDTYYQRSDHYNFARKGIPVVFFCDGEHPDYHQVTDHADKLGYPAMEAITRLAFWTGWKVANDKRKPKELGRQADW